MNSGCPRSHLSAEKLSKPINELELERDRDADGVWRAYVNQQIAGPYAELFDVLDALAFLQVPDFESVYRWRLKQEQELAESIRAEKTEVMDRDELFQFIQHYERITRMGLETLPDVADVTLVLDSRHEVIRSVYNDRSEIA